MRAYEFPLKMTPEGKLEVPESLIRQLPQSRAGRVIVLVEDPSETGEDMSWRQVSQEQFLAGYDEKDAIYDTV
jgi:hypothetical protein